MADRDQRFRVYVEFVRQGDPAQLEADLQKITTAANQANAALGGSSSGGGGSGGGRSGGGGAPPSSSGGGPPHSGGGPPGGSSGGGPLPPTPPIPPHPGTPPGGPPPGGSSRGSTTTAVGWQAMLHEATNATYAIGMGASYSGIPIMGGMSSAGNLLNGLGMMGEGIISLATKLPLAAFGLVGLATAAVALGAAFKAASDNLQARVASGIAVAAMSGSGFTEGAKNLGILTAGLGEQAGGQTAMSLGSAVSGMSIADRALMLSSAAGAGNRVDPLNPQFQGVARYGINLQKNRDPVNPVPLPLDQSVQATIARMQTMTPATRQDFLAHGAPPIGAAQAIEIFREIDLPENRGKSAQQIWQTWSNRAARAPDISNVAASKQLSNESATTTAAFSPLSDTIGAMGITAQRIGIGTLGGFGQLLFGTVGNRQDAGAPDVGTKGVMQDAGAPDAGTKGVMQDANGNDTADNRKRGGGGSGGPGGLGGGGDGGGLGFSPGLDRAVSNFTAGPMHDLKQAFDELDKPLQTFVLLFTPLKDQFTNTGGVAQQVFAPILNLSSGFRTVTDSMMNVNWPNWGQLISQWGQNLATAFNNAVTSIKLFLTLFPLPKITWPDITLPTIDVAGWWKTITDAWGNPPLPGIIWPLPPLPVLDIAGWWKTITDAWGNPPPKQIVWNLDPLPVLDVAAWWKTITDAWGNPPPKKITWNLDPLPVLDIAGWWAGVQKSWNSIVIGILGTPKPTIPDITPDLKQWWTDFNTAWYQLVVGYLNTPKPAIPKADTAGWNTDFMAEWYQIVVGYLNTPKPAIPKADTAGWNTNFMTEWYQIVVGYLNTPKPTTPKADTAGWNTNFMTEWYQIVVGYLNTPKPTTPQADTAAWWADMQKTWNTTVTGALLTPKPTIPPVSLPDMTNWINSFNAEWQNQTTGWTIYMPQPKLPPTTGIIITGGGIGGVGVGITPGGGGGAPPGGGGGAPPGGGGGSPPMPTQPPAGSDGIGFWSWDGSQWNWNETGPQGGTASAAFSRAPQQAASPNITPQSAQSNNGAINVTVNVQGMDFSDPATVNKIANAVGNQVVQNLRVANGLTVKAY